MAKQLWYRNILNQLPFVSNLGSNDKWFSVFGAARHNRYISEQEKRAVVFSNPAVLTVFKINCDLFSLGRPGVKDKDGVIDYVKDPALKLLKRPNPFQTGKQWQWDFMFWNMIGAANMLSFSRVVSKNNKLYWLNNDKMTFPPELLNKLDKPYMGNAEINKILQETIVYRNNDGTNKRYRLGEIMSIAGLSNGMGNWYGSQSCIDALYKVISNIEKGLDSKSINLRFSGKFMVGGEKSAQNNHYADMMPLGAQEQVSIEKQLADDKTVTAVRSLVEVKQFVENLAKLELDKAYLADYYIIGKMFGIPRDVLEAFQSSTHENQEKARGAHVSYTLSPKGEDLGEGLTDWFGYDDKNKEIVYDWSHLPFMQVFEADRADVRNKNSETLKNLVEVGVDPNEAGEDFGFNYTFKEVTPKNTSNGNTQETQNTN